MGPTCWLCLHQSIDHGVVRFTSRLINLLLVGLPACLSADCGGSSSWCCPWLQDESARRLSLLDKPEYYVSHLVGHEGEGSLLSYLRRQGLANGVSAGYSSELGDFSLYEVRGHGHGHTRRHSTMDDMQPRPGVTAAGSRRLVGLRRRCLDVSVGGHDRHQVAVDLTEQGEREAGSVLAAVMGFLALLRAQGVPDYIYDECRQLADIAWTFQARAEGAEGGAWVDGGG